MSAGAGRDRIVLAGGLGTCPATGWTAGHPVVRTSPEPTGSEVRRVVHDLTATGRRSGASRHRVAATGTAERWVGLSGAAATLDQWLVGS